MFKKIGILLLAIFLFTGCGVNIKQEGNKIYTDITKDEAYKFSDAALKTKGYKIKEESKINYYMVGVPEYNETFKVKDADKTELNVSVKDSATKNETIVVIDAIVNGRVDEKKSKQIAQDAVAEIIKELDMYGKFEITKDGQHVYQVASPGQVFDFIANYFTKNNIPIEVNQKDQGLIAVKEANAANAFNEPLTAEVKSAADETNKVTVTIKVSLKGNYDVQGNQRHADEFLSAFLAYLDSYPMAEKGLRYSYKYITFAKAFLNAKAALLENKFVLGEVDNNNYLITAQKDNMKLSVTFTEINNNIAVNLEAFAESASLDQTKDTLANKLTDELNALRDSLAKYQTILTTTKMFMSINNNDAIKYATNSLKKLGYTYKADPQALNISAVSTADHNSAHFIVVNNLGTEGISLELNTLYNTKSKNAEAIVKRENDRLLKMLGSFDKTDLK